MKKFINLILIAFISISSIAFAQDNASVLRAMKDEINRSIKELRIENLEVPYFIEYKISIKNTYSISGMLGSLNESSSRNSAQLFVNVRVGDYNFDNSNFLDFSAFFFGSDDDEESFSYRRIPLDLDYAILRRELWLATDAAYKQAVEIYSKKTASFKNRVRKDTTADFTKAPASSFVKVTPLENIRKEDYEKLVTELSAIMKDFPEVSTSIVNFEYVPETVYYANSEGTSYINNTSNAGIEMAAYTQAADGMPLANFYSAYGTKPSELPKLDSLKKAVNNELQTLINLKNSQTLDEPYSGPILLSGQAAAEIFAQVFVPQLSAYREVYTEQGKQQNERLSAFQNKIGGRVLPEFLSVSDKPSTKTYNGMKLYADVDFDDQGIKAQDIDLVIDGYLKNLLSTRTPTKRVRSSNGHARNGTSALTNMFVTSAKDKTKSYKELKDKLISLTKDRELPYSIIIKKIMNANIFTTTISQLNTTGLFVPRINRIMPAIEAYKVYPDGREELIRGTELANLTVQSFKDIIFAGNKHNVLNYFASTSGGFGSFGGGQYINASVIVPDLLFEDAELKSNEDDLPKLPLYASPLK